MDFYILGQINECINPPEDIQNYVSKEIEVKMYRPRYDPVPGQLLGLYETLGLIVVRGESSEHFLDYGFSKENSKMLDLYQKKGIPNSSRLIDIGYRLEKVVYRPNVLIFIFIFPLQLIEVKK